MTAICGWCADELCEGHDAARPCPVPFCSCDSRKGDMSKHDETEHDETTGEFDDFDAFWTEHDTRPARGVKVMGEWVELPKALPLQFELEARKLQKSKRDQDIRKLVGILFGKDAMERWAAKGMDFDQFQVLLAWGPRRIAGDSVTFAEVAAELAEKDTDPT